MRWEADGPDGAGVWTDLRGPTACEVLTAARGRRDPGPARTRPAAARADGGRAFRAHRREPDADRRPAHGPVGARRRRQRVPRRAALPARRLAVPARPRHRRRRSGRRMWADLVPLMRAGVRLGRIVTTRPEDRSRRRGAGAARGRPLRLPAHRTALPGLRHRGAHRGAWSAATSTGARVCQASLSHRHRSSRPQRPTGPEHACTFAADEKSPALGRRRRPRRRWRRSWPRPATASAAVTDGRLRRLLPAVRDDAPLRDRAFGVVGVNGGLLHARPTRASPPSSPGPGSPPARSRSQPKAQLYLNTANPGERDAQVAHLAEDRRDARTAPAPARNSTACSWQYGWERAQNSVVSFFTPAAQAATVDSRPRRYTWWLDVETMQHLADRRRPPPLGPQPGDARGHDGLPDRAGRPGRPLLRPGSSGADRRAPIPTSSNLAGRNSWLAGATSLTGAQRRLRASRPSSPAAR